MGMGEGGGTCEENMIGFKKMGLESELMWGGRCFEG
jgi:hypothetical protein